MDGGDSEATSGAGIYMDPRVAATAEDYPDEPVGEDFTTNRSQSTVQKYSKGSVLLKSLAQANPTSSNMIA